VACDGRWWGYFPLSGEVVWNPVDVGAPYTLITPVADLANVPHQPLARTHLSLDKDAPDGRLIEPPGLGAISPIPEVGGLHHRYVRRAA
jgi:hypothetical protein